jgi:hypothetical protein
VQQAQPNPLTRLKNKLAVTTIIDSLVMLLRLLKPIMHF